MNQRSTISNFLLNVSLVFCAVAASADQQAVASAQDGVSPQEATQPVAQFGLHGRASAALAESVAAAGVHAAARVRIFDRFAVDLGAGAYGGRDYNGMYRYELPATADVLFYINPEDRLQAYLLAGVGLSFAHAELHMGRTTYTREYRYMGAQLGAGGEYFLSSNHSINVDVRLFGRENFEGSSPEFEVRTASGNLLESDASFGGLVGVGTTYYFD